MPGGGCGWGRPWPEASSAQGLGSRQTPVFGARREEMEECTSSMEASVSLFLLVPGLPLNQSSSWPQLLICVMLV